MKCSRCGSFVNTANTPDDAFCDCDEAEEALRAEVAKLTARLAAIEPVFEAARAWRYGMVRTDYGWRDSDDGNAEPGLMRRPARDVLIDAIDNAVKAGGR